MSHGNNVEFMDLFDWEKESDRHYYKLIATEQEWEEFEQSAKPTIVKYETSIKPPKVPRASKKILQLRSYLSSKVNRAKGRP